MTTVAYGMEDQRGCASFPEPNQSRLCESPISPKLAALHR